jgi:hypothetical protein
MRLDLSDETGTDSITLHSLYLVPGRLDWTDNDGARHRGPVPVDFRVTGKVYVRLDTPTATWKGSAEEVSLDYNFGAQILTVDGKEVPRGPGFTLYVSNLYASKAKLDRFVDAEREEI